MSFVADYNNASDDDMRPVKALKIELWVLAEEKIDSKTLLKYICEDVRSFTETVISVEAELLEEQTHILFPEDEAQA